MEEIEFDHLGSFVFSPQDGTRAMALADDFLPDGIGRDRLEELLEVQRAISADRLSATIGRKVQAIVDEGGEVPVARTWGQADDVDGVTLLDRGNGLAVGTLVEAEIVDADDYDLRAEVRDVVRPPPQGPVGRRRRSLPVLPLGLEAVWGR